MTKEIRYKLTFRLFERADVENKTKWMRNPAVRSNLGWQIRQGTNLKDQLKWFEKYQRNKNDRRFIIEADGKPIGIVGLTEGDPVDKNAELYVVIGENGYRGQGIGRAACKFIIDYGFDKLKLHKILLVANGYNLKAIGLYKTLGFVEEGRLRDQILKDGKYYEEVYLGLINPNDQY